MFRRKHYVEVVKCPVCGEYTEKSTNDKTVIIKGKAPESVLPKSYCSPELLAHIFYEKYAKAVPLERLSKDFKSMKAEISTPTLANWVIEASERYLKPIYEQLHTELLKERVIHADETVNPSQGTGLAKAVQYARNEKSYLYAFLEDPQIPIDNNLAERAVKPFVIGRKNWLFSTSPKGADARFRSLFDH